MNSRSGWNRLETLGEGTFASIFLALHANGNKVAVKTAKLEKLNTLIKENKILKYFYNCQKIVQFYNDKITNENGVLYYNLLLEYAPTGDLYNLIVSAGGRMSDENVVRRYTRMILRGLYCIHVKVIVHCDIKPENILAFLPNMDINLKITDFRLTKEPDEVVSRFCGTPNYMYPEYIEPCREIQIAVDIWSLRCAVLEMKTCNHPWKISPLDAYDPRLVIRLLTSTKLTPEIPKHMSDIGKNFLTKCVQRDPSKKWPALKLLDHPYISTTAYYSISCLRETI